MIAFTSIGPVASPLRFTLDGSDELERRFGSLCKTIMAGIRGLIPSDRLEAVLLGGGYGRGEGGVLRVGGAEEPYNDLEFYVCLRGNRHLNERRFHLPLEVLGEVLTPMAGVEIEFKIISLAELRRSRISMFSYDLILGHRWLLGDGGLLFGFTRHRIAEDIPLVEATRLLMNRCSGLLFAQERLARDEFTAADADFVRRNIAKAELAFGDAVLAAHGQYHWSCEERQRRLRGLIPTQPLCCLDEVRIRHAAGLDFKLNPVRSADSRIVLQARQTAVVALALDVWLWQETRRLGMPFASALAYSRSKIDKCPDSRCRRNLLVNLKNARFGSFLKLNPFRHPRERVLHDLCRLLWEEAAPPSPASQFADRVARYKRLWRRVN